MRTSGLGICSASFCWSVVGDILCFDRRSKGFICFGCSSDFNNWQSKADMYEDMDSISRVVSDRKISYQ